MKQSLKELYHAYFSRGAVIETRALTDCYEITTTTNDAEIPNCLQGASYYLSANKDEPWPFYFHRMK
jgi:hypothetical protein